MTALAFLLIISTSLTSFSCSSQKASGTTDDYNRILNAYVNSGPIGIEIESKRYPTRGNDWSQDKITEYYKINETDRYLIQEDQHFFYSKDKSLWINHNLKLIRARENKTEEDRNTNVRGDLVQSHIKDILELGDSIKFTGLNENGDKVFMIYFQKRGRKNATLVCDSKTYRTKSISIFLIDADKGWKEVINYNDLPKDRIKYLKGKFEEFDSYTLKEVQDTYSDYVLDY